MRRSTQVVATLVVVLGCLSAGLHTPASAQETVVRLAGRTGTLSQWSSGYLNLSVPTDFHRGDRLRITIGGSAARVVVRLLPVGYSPDSPDLIVATKAEVKSNKTVEIVLESDYLNISQISVHGGNRPWDQFPLGDGNGAATVLKVERLTR